MSFSSYTENGVGVVTVSSDLYTATALYDPAGGQPRPTAEGVIEELERAGVKITDLIRTNVERFVSRLDEPATPVGPTVIAGGIRPIYGSPEHVAWAEPHRAVVEEWRGSMDAKAYPTEAIVRVEAGHVIGHVEDAVRPRDGRDLTGASVVARGRAESLVLDENITRSEDCPAVLTANASGRLERTGQHLTIVPVFTVPGDVGSEAGRVTAESSLWIDGRVTDGATVYASDQVCVNGSIEGAGLDVRGSVYIRHNVEGRRRTTILADGDISAKCATRALFVAGQDLNIGAMLRSCQVCVGRRLQARAARLAGGTVFVTGNAHVGTLGDADGAPSHLAVGVDAPTVFKIALAQGRIQSLRLVSNQLQRVIHPLSDDARKLSTEQERRLRVTMAKMTHAERAIEQEERRCAELFDDVVTGEGHSITIARQVHPGVTVCVGERMYVFKHPLAGPVRIELRRLDGRIQLVTVTPSGAVIRALSSERIGVAELIRPFAIAGFPKL